MTSADTPNDIQMPTFFFSAQHYVENSGYDAKLYVAATQVFAVAKRSPLHPKVEVDKCLLPINLVATHMIDIAARRVRQRLDHSIYDRVSSLVNEATASA